MQPLVRAAFAAALLAALGSLGKTPPPKAPEAEKAKAPFVPGIPAACGPRTLPEGQACLPLPKPGQASPGGQGELGDDEARPGASARQTLVPRRPERPREASAYHVPLSGDAAPMVLGGLDRPWDLGAGAEGVSVGPSAVLFGAAAGDEVVALSLDGQEGPSEVVFVGDMVGATIVTAHLVRDGGKLRQVLLVHGNLAAFGGAITEGISLEAGEVLATVGDSAWPGRPGLYLEVLELREGVNLGAIPASKLRADTISVPTDARNHLPLR